MNRRAGKIFQNSVGVPVQQNNRCINTFAILLGRRNVRGEVVNAPQHVKSNAQRFQPNDYWLKIIAQYNSAMSPKSA
ncbi:MAG: hypothetical protein LBJ67_04050 [Planctomycetaceae bacterium]|nr:hypothetical protein [Planctomycetaceae bacterium]